MSSELRDILVAVLKEDLESREAQVEKRVDDFKSLILEVAKAGKQDYLVWAEGSESGKFRKREADLGLLERSNLVKSQMKYGHRNAYRQVELTKKGMDLADKLLKE